MRNNPYEDFCDIKDYDLSKDKILDMNKVIREVSHADIRLWSIISTIHENNSWSDIEDCLQEIINKNPDPLSDENFLISTLEDSDPLGRNTIPSSYNFQTNSLYTYFYIILYHSGVRYCFKIFFIKFID